MPRPYMKQTAGDLEAIARAHADDAAVLTQVLDELNRRTTQKAEDATRVVLQLLTDARRGCGAHGGSEGELAEATATTPPSGPPTPGAVVDPALDGAGTSDPSLLVRYEALRSTFTAESEALARWGLTSLMPQEMRRMVFDAWRERVRSDPHAHPLGLNEADLSATLHTLSREFTPDGQTEPR